MASSAQNFKKIQVIRFPKLDNQIREFGCPDKFLVAYPVKFEYPIALSMHQWFS